MRELVKHKAFTVLLRCMLLQGIVYGVISNCLGVFTVAICDDCGFSRGDFGLLTTLRMVFNAVALLIMPRFIYGRWKNKLRYSITVLGSLLFISYGAGAFLHDVKAWYVVGVLIGIGMSTFVVNQSYILGNWFHKYTNLAVGLSGAATGVAGMVLNPLASMLIQAIGWRKALICLTLLGLAIVWLTGFRMHYTPEEEGLKPFGADMPQEAEKQQRSTPAKVVVYPITVFIPVALLVMIPHCINETLSTSNSYFPTYATELGYHLSTAAVFATFGMVGNMIGKVTIGIMFDHMDWRVATCVFEGVVLAGVVGLMLARECLPLTLLFCLMVGMIQCSSSVFLNAVARHVFGSQNYVNTYSAITSVSFVGVAVLYALAGYSYDHTGSFHDCFVFIIIAICAVLALMPLLFTLRARFGKETETLPRS